MPTQDKIDFRAACFCHKNIVDIGFVCSVCLSSERDMIVTLNLVVNSFLCSLLPTCPGVLYVSVGLILDDRCLEHFHDSSIGPNSLSRHYSD